MVGGWVDRDKKWMVGWMDINIKDGWLDGWRKNMDSYMGRKHGQKTWMVGWIEKMDGWMVSKKYGSWMDIKNIQGWLDGYKTIDGQFDASKKWMVRQKIQRWMDGYTTIDGWLNGQKKKMKKQMDGWLNQGEKMDGQIEDTKMDGWIYNRWMVEWIEEENEKIDGQMDRDNKWTDAQKKISMDRKQWMAGWTEKKWMVGSGKKNMDGWMDNKKLMVGWI